MCRLLLVTIACLLILFGISGLWMMPKLIQQKIEQRMQLKIGTKNYERFTKIPIPITVKFYLFNITNSEQVLLGLERPQFQEVGPFMYKQWRRREVIDIIDNNRRIVYKEIKTFYPMFETISKAPDNAASSTITTSKNDNSTTTTNRHISESEQQSIFLRENSKQQQLHNNNNNNNDSSINSSASDNMKENGYEQTYLDPSKFNITIVNLPLLSVLTKLAQLDEGSLKRNVAAKVASRLISDGKDKILITRPANQLLFDGYKVPFMESARDLISDTLGFNFESPLPNNKFGFFHTKNGTWTRKDNGEMTVFTGRNDSMNDFMIVDNFNGLKQLNVWPTNTEAGNRCNEIKGTDGSQFHPGVDKQQILSIFSPMICTSIHIKYKEDTSVRDIPLLRFSTPADVFAAPKKSPRNACYCTIQNHHNNHQHHQSWNNVNSFNEHQKNGQKMSSQISTGLSNQRSRITNARCYLDGLMDLSLCQRGAPIAASSPHFYNADPMLAMAAGLKPNKEIHETYLDIEPMTGAVFRAASRAQLNAYVEQAALDVVDKEIIGSMTAMVAPMLWLEESAQIDEKSTKEFKGQLLNTVQKARRSFIYSIAFGILVIIVVAVQYWYVTCYKIDTRKVIPRDVDDDDNSSVDRLSIRKRRQQLQQRRRLEANLRLAAGARRSNLAAKLAKKPLLSGLEQKQSVDQAQEPASTKTGARVVGMAAVLGATSELRKASGSGDGVGNHRPARTQMADYGNEEELSRQNLVENEWQLGEVTRSNTSGSSGGHSTNQIMTPTTSKGGQVSDCC